MINHYICGEKMNQTKQTIFILLFLLLAPVAAIYPSHSFDTFTTNQQTGGTPFTKSLDVASLSDDYLVYVVTADFVGSGGDPSYSSSIHLEINNGGTEVYKISAPASAGAAQNTNSTSLTWTGVMTQVYSGGSNLTIKFDDTDGSYTYTLNNVSVTIYETPTPIKAFGSFTTGGQTGGTPYTSSMDVTGLTLDYLFYTASADFVGSGGDPSYSHSIDLELNNGGSTDYKLNGPATLGGAASSSATTLKWSGIFTEKYEGGSNLTIKFDDDDGAYTYTLNNVAFIIYPAPTEKAFTQFNTGTQTGGTPYTNSLDVTGLTADYLFYTVSADFVGVGGDPSFSNNISLELNNGGSTVYKTAAATSIGAQANGNATTLKWSGTMKQIYPGGGNLTIKFDDDNGAHSYSLSNVALSIYPVPSSSPAPVELTSFTASANENSIELTWHTATEINNYGFQVERSVNRTLSGLEVWQTVPDAFIPGAGNSNSPKKYKYIDDLTDLEKIPETIEYRLKQTDTDGSFEYSDVVAVETQNFASLPTNFKLHQNYPNPFNPVTKIKFSIGQAFQPVPAQTVHTTLRIYNSLGAEVATLVNELKSPGTYEVEWDAAGIASGIYFCEMKSGSYSETMKLILMK